MVPKLYCLGFCHIFAVSKMAAPSVAEKRLTMCCDTCKSGSHWLVVLSQLIMPWVICLSGTCMQEICECGPTYMHLFFWKYLNIRWGSQCSSKTVKKWNIWVFFYSFFIYVSSPRSISNARIPFFRWKYVFNFNSYTCWSSEQITISSGDASLITQKALLNYAVYSHRF